MTILHANDTASGRVLYMALELSAKTWKVGFGDGRKERVCTVAAGDWPGLHEQMRRAREKLGLAPGCRVVSCYEAGRDGFWIHRALVGEGVENRVIDSSSIEVNRRRRRTKTDQVDARSLLRLLIRYTGGERKALSVVRVPSVAEEDRRRLHRERERLLKERGAHRARLQALLATQGVRLEWKGDFLAWLEAVRAGGTGAPLGAELKAELRREYARYCLVDGQVRALEQEQRRRVEQARDGALRQVWQLRQLRGVGWQSSWLLVMELFGWRRFGNRRQLAACVGLTPSPYASGETVREQGISKAGSRRVRRLMVELSWLWLRYQPGSELSRWFARRFAQGGKRMRRIGIVALARKLLIALWRYLEDGELPAGAVLAARGV